MWRITFRSNNPSKKTLQMESVSTASFSSLPGWPQEVAWHLLGPILFCRSPGLDRSGADPPCPDRGAAVADKLLDRTHIPLNDPVVDIGNA